MAFYESEFPSNYLIEWKPIFYSGPILCNEKLSEEEGDKVIAFFTPTDDEDKD